MAVAKRQGREKPAKIEQRKVKGRSKDQSGDFRENKQQSWLAQSAQGRPRGKRKHIKGGAKALSFSLSLPHVCALFLFLSPSLSPNTGTVLHSLLFHLWVGMPSRFEDGFSCYLLNKIEL